MKTWNHYIYKILNENHLATLTTTSENFIWSSPLFFTVHKNLDLYILLNTTDQHFKNLIFLPKASLIIENQTLEPFSLQLAINTNVVKKSTRKVQEMYKNLLVLHAGDTSLTKQTENINWKVIKLTPTQFFLIDKNRNKQEEIFLKAKAISPQL